MLMSVSPQILLYFPVCRTWQLDNRRNSAPDAPSRINRRCEVLGDPHGQPLEHPSYHLYASGVAFLQCKPVIDEHTATHRAFRSDGNNALATFRNRWWFR